MPTPNPKEMQRHEDPFCCYLSDFSLGTLASYASLLTSLEPNRKSYELSAVLCSNTTSAQWLTKRLIQQVSAQNLASIKPGATPSTAKMVLLHKNDDPHLKAVLMEISRRRIECSDKELLSMTLSCIKTELHTHISEQLHKVGINLSVEESDFDIFSRFLEKRSLSELNMVVWQVAQNISSADTRFFSLSGSDGGLLEYLESAFLETCNKYETNKRKIKRFEKEHRNRSTLSLILFNQIFQIDGRYYHSSIQEIWSSDPV